MPVCFKASQSVEIPVEEQPIPIQHYLRQPQRLIQALVDPSRVEALSHDCFRLKMRPLNFMMLSVQPIVDLRIWSEADGAIRLESIRSEIRGVEYFNERFHLNLVGRLTPEVTKEVTYLRGRADLTVQVELPLALAFTPKPILEATGNGLLHSILLTIKQRLMHQLLADYRKWAIAQVKQPVEGPSVLLPNSSII